MTIKTSRLDIAEWLETDADIQEFLAETAREGTPSDLVHALNIAARARGMSEIARQSGLTRASLYKSLSESGNPQFDTIARICGAFGMKLTVTPQHTA